MKYVLLLCADETTPKVDISAECVRWSTGLGDRLVGAMGLHPPDPAATVRVRNGEVLVTDGPFAETKEQMGGLSMIECDSEEEARRIAATHPWARFGMIEVRRVLDGATEPATRRNHPHRADPFRPARTPGRRPSAPDDRPAPPRFRCSPRRLVPFHPLSLLGAPAGAVSLTFAARRAGWCRFIRFRCLPRRLVSSHPLSPLAAPARASPSSFPARHTWREPTHRQQSLS